MKTKEKKTSGWVRILCWILIAMMLIGAATYAIYALMGIL